MNVASDSTCLSDGTGDNQAVEELAAAIDQIQVAVGHRIERAGIDGKLHGFVVVTVYPGGLHAERALLRF